jgi:hypothetical protein
VPLTLFNKFFSKCYKFVVKIFAYLLNYHRRRQWMNFFFHQQKFLRCNIFWPCVIISSNIWDTKPYRLSQGWPEEEIVPRIFHQFPHRATYDEICFYFTHFSAKWMTFPSPNNHINFFPHLISITLLYCQKQIDLYR